jgi:transposase
MADDVAVARRRREDVEAVVRGGDVAGLLERFARLREKTRARTGKVFPFVVIQEADLDGFWIDRALQNKGIESHVVDPASIETSSAPACED